MYFTLTRGWKKIIELWICYKWSEDSALILPSEEKNTNQTKEKNKWFKPYYFGNRTMEARFSILWATIQEQRTPDVFKWWRHQCWSAHLGIIPGSTEGITQFSIMLYIGWEY